MTWTELDSATTSPLETDIPFGPITTKTSLQGQVVVAMDNMATQHPHYSLIPNYVNQAAVELLTLGISLTRNVLDQLPRLQNWRWADATIDGQNWLYLPERLLYLESVSYSQSLTAYDSSTTTLYPASIYPGSARDFGILPRTTKGYPTLYRRAGSRLELWPTPSSSPTEYRTQIVVAGTRMDNILSDSADTLLMSPRMQNLVIELAVAITMEKAGWDEATERRATVEGKLGRLLGIGEKESVQHRIRTRVGGFGGYGGGYP